MGFIEMTKKEALEVLEHHQKWRKGADTEMTDIYKLSEALIIAIQVLKKNLDIVD